MSRGNKGSSLEGSSWIETYLSSTHLFIGPTIHSLIRPTGLDSQAQPNSKIYIMLLC